MEVLGHCSGCLHRLEELLADGTGVCVRPTGLRSGGARVASGKIERTLGDNNSGISGILVRVLATFTWKR